MLNCSHTEGTQVFLATRRFKRGQKMLNCSHTEGPQVSRDPQNPHTEAAIAHGSHSFLIGGGIAMQCDLANRYASVEHSHIDLGGVYVVGLMR